MTDSSCPDAFPPFEARLAASFCRSMASEFERSKGLPNDRDIAQLIAIDAVLDEFKKAGFLRPELEEMSAEQLARLTNDPVLSVVKDVFEWAERTAKWARKFSPEEPS